MNTLRWLWKDDCGAVLSAELILIVTIMVIGLVTGLVCLQKAVVAELQDVGGAIGSLDQTYTYNGFSSRKRCCQGAATHGSYFVDREDGVREGRQSFEERSRRRFQEQPEWSVPYHRNPHWRGRPGFGRPDRTPPQVTPPKEHAPNLPELTPPPENAPALPKTETPKEWIPSSPPQEPCDPKKGPCPPGTRLNDDMKFPAPPVLAPTVPQTTSPIPAPTLPPSVSPQTPGVIVPTVPSLTPGAVPQVPLMNVPSPSGVYSSVIAPPGTAVEVWEGVPFTPILPPVYTGDQPIYPPGAPPEWYPAPPNRTPYPFPSCEHCPKKW